MIKSFNPSSPPNQQAGNGIGSIDQLQYRQSTWREVKVENNEGEGSEFTVSLPA